MASLVACGAEGGSVPEPSDEAVAESSEALRADAPVAQAGAEQQAAAPDAEGCKSGHRGGPAAFHPGPPGPDFLLTAALRELTLSDAQKSAIEAAMTAARPAPPADADAARPRPERSPFAALAAGVRAGKIDRSMMQRPAQDRAPNERVSAMASAIQTLHDTLTQEQRRQLVDGFAKRMAEHKEPAGAEKGERGGQHARGPRGGAFHKGAGPIGHMLADLELTDAQRQTIEKQLEAKRPAAPDAETMKQRFEGMQKQMQARMEAFVSDSFDAKAFAAPPAMPEAEASGQKGDPMVEDLSVIVSVLDATQREKLAARLEKGPTAMKGRGPRGSARVDQAL